MFEFTTGAIEELKATPKAVRAEVQDIAQHIARAHSRWLVRVEDVRKARMAAGRQFAPGPGAYVEDDPCTPST